MPRLALPDRPPPFWPKFRSTARGITLTARVGRLLGIAFAICMVTGLISHYQYGPWRWLPVPSAPVWGFRLTQGVHVVAGIALIPLLLLKLWSVYPKLFVWPPARNVVHGLERLSVFGLIASALVEVFTGFLNVLNWYPWPWSFTEVHFWLAWVVSGSIVLHIAVQLPVIRRGLSAPLSPPRAVPADDVDPPPPPASDGITRRGVLLAAGAGAGLVAITVSGQTVPALEGVGLLAARKPDTGPLHVPINRTAKQAQVENADASYRLHVVGPKSYDLDMAAIEALDTQRESYPIACVEGWSASATWTGPRVLDLVERVGGDGDSRVQVTSLEKEGTYKVSVLLGPHLRAALLATHLNGERLTLDHGYPVRIIAPNRPGVFNTKWVTELKVL